PAADEGGALAGGREHGVPPAPARAAPTAALSARPSRAGGDAAGSPGIAAPAALAHLERQAVQLLREDEALERQRVGPVLAAGRGGEGRGQRGVVEGRGAGPPSRVEKDELVARRGLIAVAEPVIREPVS